MAAKTTIKSEPALAAGLARLQPALAAWRERRKHREPIPETLWRAMAAVARVHGLSPVAQALRVNYTTLKRHVEVSSPPQASRADPQPPEFIEVPMSACSGDSQCVIELENHLGLRMTLRWARGGGTEVLALARDLWRSRG